MAFTYTITHVTYWGDRKVVYGKFASTGGSTGGDIKTGLETVENIQLSHTGAAVVASAPVVNETLPLANGGDVTIVTVADTAGTFVAIGY